MKTEQSRWNDDGGWAESAPGKLGEAAQLVLLFGGTEVMSQAKWMPDLRQAYPKAHLFGCTTAGEIIGTRVYDDSLIATGVQFERTQIQTAQVRMSDAGDDSRQAGSKLGAALKSDGLVHVLVISDGLSVNGSELVRGLLGALPDGVRVTGGLAGDGARFEKTSILAGETPIAGAIGAVGFYGDNIKVGYGSLGGWDSFGPERLITRSEGNVLFELDGKPALELYKSYLGEHAADLPSSGLLFPLNVRAEGEDEALVRTILAVDNEANSLTFAGDVPEGSHAQLMKANFDRLIEGASGAAQASGHAIGGAKVDLAILISCVGRKLVLKQRTEEEVEAVRDVVGDQATLAGFYSYGEICPAAPNADCKLHNQTMTITTFAESE
ncbi:MAG: FIST N-terminal domain-containing protein [Myxococcota bacterium]